MMQGVKSLRTTLFLLAVSLIGIALVAYLVFTPTEYRGKTISEWVTQLCNAHSYRQSQNAAFALKEIGPPATAVMAEALKKGRTGVNAWWSPIYTRLPTSLQRFLPPPEEWELSDKRPIFGVLADIGRPRSTVMRAMKAGVNHSHREMRVFAISSFKRMAPEYAPQIVPILIDSLSDSAGNVRSSAAAALGDFRQAAKQGVPHLVKRLSTESMDRFRWSAAAALGEIGVGSQSVVKALKTALTDPDIKCRAYSAWALWRVTGSVEAPLETMKGILSSGDPKGCLAASSLLADMKPEALKLMPEIENLLSHEERLIRIHAARCVWRLTGEGDKMVSILIKALRNGGRVERIDAAEALALFGTEGAKAVPALVEVLNDDSKWLARKHAAIALGKIGEKTGEVISTLNDAATHDSSFEVERAAQAALKSLNSVSRNGQGSQ